MKDHYYPFGLNINALSSVAPLSKPNKYNTFQGQERIEDFDLNWYQYQWRNHDPTIGRFFNVDPIAESFYYNSPYAFSENKVVSHIELEGLEGADFRSRAVEASLLTKFKGGNGKSYAQNFKMLQEASRPRGMTSDEMRFVGATSDFVEVFTNPKMDLGFAGSTLYRNTRKVTSELGPLMDIGSITVDLVTMDPNNPEDVKEKVENTVGTLVEMAAGPLAPAVNFVGGAAKDPNSSLSVSKASQGFATSYGRGARMTQARIAERNRSAAERKEKRQTQLQKLENTNSENKKEEWLKKN